MTPHRIPELRQVLFAFALAAVPACVWALPEDDTQKIETEDYASIDLSLERGEVIQKGHPGVPTCITQGSRVICGDEIRIEYAEDGGLKKVTAIGTPATFQLKPAANQEIAFFSGLTLIFDNAVRRVTIDGDAEYTQGDTAMAHQHLEYGLDTGTLSLSGPEGERGRARFVPQPRPIND